MGFARSYIRRIRRGHLPIVLVTTLSILGVLLGLKILGASQRQEEYTFNSQANSGMLARLRARWSMSLPTDAVFVDSLDVEYVENTKKSDATIPVNRELVIRHKYTNDDGTAGNSLLSVSDEQKQGRNNTNQSKYLLLLGHYEQLGMSTVNFLNAAYLAQDIGRRVVLPLVRHSRFCGIPTGWSGTLRRTTRRFYPMNIYYNDSHLFSLLKHEGVNGFVTLNEFLNQCSKAAGESLKIVYFLYDKDPLHYLKLNKSEETEIKQKVQGKGWTECNFINNDLNIQNRFESDVTIGKQFCVDPEIMTKLSAFDKEVAGDDSCLVFLLWKGIGDQRAHFKFTVHTKPKLFLGQIKPSNLVLDEMTRFSNKFNLTKRYIGVHIRSERQILWHGLQRFKRCLHLLSQAVNDLKKQKKMHKVLVATDAGKYGSDQLFPYLNKSESEEVVSAINKFVRSVNGQTYQVRKLRDPLWTDTGLVALTELHLLSKSRHLVTLGAGTFQNWLIDVFRLHKTNHKIKAWSITRACSKESKRQGKEKGKNS